jgi:hypothetical protein
MSSQEGNVATASPPSPPPKRTRDAPPPPALNVADFPSKTAKKRGQRKLTPKQLMKLKRSKDRDEKKAAKQKEQELRASYTALAPVKTTLDPSERVPTVGDKLIVRDEYNLKYVLRCECVLYCCNGVVDSC